MTGCCSLVRDPCWLDSDSAGCRRQAVRTCSKVALLQVWALRAVVVGLEVPAAEERGLMNRLQEASVLVAWGEDCCHWVVGSWDSSSQAQAIARQALEAALWDSRSSRLHS